MLSLMGSHSLGKIINNSLSRLPRPSNLSTWWNFGSLLGACLVFQLISGLFLAIFFYNSRASAFERIVTLESDLHSTWLIRLAHANGARFFFFCLYFHVRRGIYYHSFHLPITWGIGVVMLLTIMGVAFLGYVLPWGQISFWGTSVITNLASAIPYIGDNLVLWVWGSLAVRSRTLTRFFALHFMIPFAVAFMTVVHLLFLHQTGSSNPLGISLFYTKVSFNPFFIFKDFIGIMIIITLFLLLILNDPWGLGDPENFLMADSLTTPIHIQPEWYFLFAYAVLRSIPNKLGGVVALGAAVLVLFIFVTSPLANVKGNPFYFIRKVYFWRFIGCVLLLTWIGARPVEDPFIITGQLLTIYYFLFYLSYPYSLSGWDLLNQFNWNTYLILKIKALICHS